EAEWQQAEVETDFMQYDPTAGAEPTEKTEVRIIYNDEYLFVGLRAYDSEPDKLINLSLERDFELSRDDGFAFVIDTYNDKSTALAFITNTLNARWDAEFSQDGNNSNVSYNTFWDVASHIDSLGYTTEYRIPFSSLRFKTKDKVIMGFRIIRLIKRKSEFEIFPKCNPDVDNAYFKVSLAREMEFTDLKSKKPFYIIPYVTANYSKENILNDNGNAYIKNSAFIIRKNYVKNKALDKLLSNTGIDAKYGLSKNFTIDLTLNTDFAQAEVDNLIVNLTKYDVNLPEKRSFFLESQNYLSYTTSPGDELFISRSIGIENGLIAPIIAGARITGKSGDWQMGALNMQTTAIEADSIDAHNFFVFRTRKFTDSLGSFLGGIITNKINTGAHAQSYQSIGAGGVKVFNQNLVFTGSISGTFKNADITPFAKSVYYNLALIRSAKEGWNYFTEFSLIGKDFDPAMGYVQENDLGNFALQGGYIWKAKEKSKIAYYYVHGNSRYKWKPSFGKEETKFINGEAGVSFKSGAETQTTPFEYLTDTLFEVWNITEHIHIPQNKYYMFTPDIDFTLPQQSNYTGQLSIKGGDFYGGKRISLKSSITYIFNKHFKTGIEYEYNHIQFPVEFSNNGNALFQSNLLRINIAYFFSSKFSVKLFTQLDDLSKQVTSNLRIRYNPQEGTDLYIVFNQGLNTDRTRLNPHLPVINTQAVTVKFVKTFDMR
ncbi:MAG: carbohydrate binding family 9 domain-containing protein, partial [Bacteroidota bacterium]|nr:carbohydrate binding family 9 domain-containing protein [Bacteroidota bacterium]